MRHLPPLSHPFPWGRSWQADGLASFRPGGFARLALAQTPPLAPPADAAAPRLRNAEEGSTIAADAFAPACRAWLSAEYLLWKLPRETVPVLVGTIPAVQAELSRTLPAGTIRPLFGGPGSPVDFGMQSGWRVDGGCWFDSDGGFGLDGAGFQLPSAGRRAGFQSGGDPVVGPVFQDADGEPGRPHHVFGPRPAHGVRGRRPRQCPVGRGNQRPPSAWAAACCPSRSTCWPASASSRWTKGST